jgi:tripartite-type tricarboxylate transporter receptor subunit TctC
MADTYTGQRVRVVIGSTSTSGDTYLATETTCRYLAKYLGADVRVDPVGMSEAFNIMKTAKTDGLTIMGFHDGTYLSTLFGTYDESYSLDHYVIGPRYGQNPGCCFMVRVDAPYNSMIEIAEYMVANPDQVIRVAIEAGSVSHVGFAAYYVWVAENYGEEVAKRFRVALSGSTSTKLQMLWDGNIDLLFADYSGQAQYTEEGIDANLKLKFVGMLDDIPGVEGLPMMYDEGITLGGEPFHFSKDFLFYLPEGTDPAIVAELDAAMTKLAEDPEYIAAMQALTYAPNVLLSAEADAFIKEKNALMGEIIAAMPSVDDMME